MKEFLITLFSVFILYSPSLILYCIPFLIPWPHLRLGLIAVLIKEFYFNISVNCWADEWNQWNFACQSFKAAMMKWYRLKWSIHFHAHLLWSICFYSQHSDMLVHSSPVHFFVYWSSTWQVITTLSISKGVWQGNHFHPLIKLQAYLCGTRHVMYQSGDASCG